MQLIASALSQSAWVRNVRDVAGSRAEPWFKNLPSLVEALRENWGLSSLAVRSGLTYSLILGARYRDREAILKIHAPGMLFAEESAWYRAQTSGVPEVWERDESRLALLLERVAPGVPLSQESRDEIATRQLAAAIRSLGAAAPSAFPFRRVRELAGAFRTLEGRVDAGLVQAARDVFAERGDGDAVLHGDLHHDNVLIGANGELKVIDPHGYRGPRAFEVGCLFHNPLGWNPESPRLALSRRADILTEELGFPRAEILDWAFAYTLMSAAWSAEDGRPVPARELEIARVLAGLAGRATFP